MSEGTKYRFRFTATYEVDVDAANYPDNVVPLEVERDNAAGIIIMAIQDEDIDVEVEWLETDYSVSRTSG